jgi:hypothetical protein
MPSRLAESYVDLKLLRLLLSVTRLLVHPLLKFMNLFTRRSPGKQRLVVVPLLALAAILSSSALAVPPPSSPSSHSIRSNEESQRLGERLVQRFFSYLSMTGNPTGVIANLQKDDSKERRLLKSILDKHVIIQRADGEFFNHRTYWPIDVDDFKISDLHVTRPATDLLVVRYRASTPGAVSLTTGGVSGADAALRLTTFRYNEKKKDWLVLSHANFNQPVAQMCDKPALKWSSALNDETANLPRAKEAEELVEKFWVDVRRVGKASVVPGGLVIPETQIVVGDGYSRDGSSGARNVKTGAVAKRDFYATGDSRVLVARYLERQNAVINDVQFVKDWQPALVTFFKVAPGQWRLASFAFFFYPSSPPAGVKCVRSASPVR